MLLPLWAGGATNTSTTSAQGTTRTGLKGCEEARFASATKLEGQVWEFVRSILLDPAELRSDLDRAIVLEKEGRYGDPEAEAKHWL